MKGINSKELRSIIQDLDDIKSRVESVRDEADEYYNKRSEKWQEGDAAQELEERIGELDETADSLEGVILQLNEIEGG